MKINDIIWLLPILCLLGSIVYCSIRLCLRYRNAIQIWAHRALEKVGLRKKIGMGQRNRLRRYLLCYAISAIASVFTSIAISVATEKGVFEQIVAFVKDLNAAKSGKFFATLGFAIFTVIESLLIYERDFSKTDREKSKLQMVFSRHFWKEMFLVFVWLVAGGVVYKDFFLRSIHEWISSPGRVFQLCFGLVSVGILGFSVFNSVRSTQDE